MNGGAGVKETKTLAGHREHGPGLGIHPADVRADKGRGSVLS